MNFYSINGYSRESSGSMIHLGKWLRNIVGVISSKIWSNKCLNLNWPWPKKISCRSRSQLWMWNFEFMNHDFSISKWSLTKLTNKTNKNILIAHQQKLLHYSALYLLSITENMSKGQEVITPPPLFSPFYTTTK